MKTLKTKLTIGRPSRGWTLDEAIVIRIEDKLSHSLILELEIEPALFALALTGRAVQDSVTRYYDDAPIGKRREHKLEFVQPRPGHVDPKDQDWFAAAILAPYEKDGWKGRPGDLYNSHLWIENEAGERGCKVSFERYIDIEEEDGSPSNTD